MQGIKLMKRISSIALAYLVFSGLAYAGPAAAPTPFASWETTGTMLRRLAAGAQGNNPIDNPPVQGAIAYVPYKASSAPGNTAAVTQGLMYNFNSHWYFSQIGGTTGTGTNPSTCPYNGDLSDGSVHWTCVDTLFLAGAAQAGVAMPGGSRNVFQIRQTGIPQVQSSVAISGITCATATGVATVTTAAHGMLGSAAVTIAGETPSSYNGTWNVTVASSTTYTIQGLACTANDSVHGTSVNAGPGQACVTGVNDGTIIWDCIGKLNAPTLVEAVSNDSTLTNIYMGAPASGVPPAYVPSNIGGVFRFEGGIPATRGNNGSDYYVNILGPETTGTAGQNCWLSGAPLGIEPFCNYEAVSFTAEVAGKLQINIVGDTHPVSFIVDGRYLTPDPHRSAYNGATNYYVLDFTGAYDRGHKTHTIKIEGGFSFTFISAAVGPTDSILPAQNVDDFGVAFFGTSLTAAAASSGPEYGFTNVFRYLVGLPNNLNYGIGGTGYLNPGSVVTYINHASIDLARFVTQTGIPIRLIMIEGPTNDSNATYTNANIAIAATTLVSGLHTTYPNALIIGIDSPSGNQSSIPAVGQCAAAGSPATGITLTATNGGAFIVTSGSSAAGNLLGTRYLVINEHVFNISSVATGTTLTLSSATSNDGAVTLSNATTYGCYAQNPNANLAVTAEAVKASYAAFNSPMVQYLQTAGGPPSLAGMSIMGTGTQLAADGSCYLAGTGSTTGNAYYDTSNSGPHPTNCGYRAIGYRLAAQYRQLLYAKNADGSFVIP